MSQSINNSISELYTTLIVKSEPRDLLPFLTEYAHANKIALEQAIKQARIYWLDYVNLSDDPAFAHLGGRSGWGRRANDQQFDIIVLSAIAVLDERDIKRWDETLVYLNRLDNPLVLEILEWAKPAWIGTYLLAQLRPQGSPAFNYFFLRLLEDRQLVAFDPELFALSLASFSTFTSTPPQQLAYIERITGDVVAYQRDIPLLFEYETSIHKQLFAGTPGSPKWDTAIWGKIFTKLLADSKMDRSWFIKHSIIVQTQEWNPNLRSFFRKRLEEASPSATELLIVQDLIFICLGVPLNTVIAFAIDLIYKIWNQEAFDFQSFLEFAKPVMIRTDCKGAIRKILAILDKTAAQKPQHRGAISHLTADRRAADQ